MKKSFKESIEWHRRQEREAAKLAAKYIKARNWISAADTYRAAAFHKAIHTALTSQQRDKD